MGRSRKLVNYLRKIKIEEGWGTTANTQKPGNKTFNYRLLCNVSFNFLQNEKDVYTTKYKSKFKKSVLLLLTYTTLFTF